MARKCVICSDPRVAQIDAALLENTGYREIAKRFEASESAIFRHQLGICLRFWPRPRMCVPLSVN